MLLRCGLVIAMCLAAGGAAFAGDPPPQLAKVRLDDRQIDISADGGFTVRARSELQVLSAAAVQTLAQRALNYSGTYQTLDVTDAYTLKQDGTKIPVAPSAIISQQAPNSILYSDLKQKVIVFPDVDVNDTMVQDTTTVTKPIIDRAFTYENVFPTAIAFGQVAMTFVAPKSLPLNFELHGGVTLSKAASGDKTRYTIRYSSDTPVRDDGQYVSLLDRAPRFFVSSFKTYDEFARAYAALALPKIAVTPKIQAKADEITAGVTDRKEQAKRIYDWVSTHIRYVALEFGLGSIVAHDADSVLANGYGDCKDHATLFAALLKAKGIASNLALINATNSYTLPTVPVLGIFDHVITWLPEFGIYADTTQRDFPFGLLPGPEYGKSVLLIGGDKNAVRQTPVMPDDASSFTYAETLKIDDKNRMSAQSTLTASGLTGVYIHRLADLIQQNGADTSAGNLLRSRDMPGAKGTFTFPKTTADGITITATYQTQPGPVTDNGIVLPLGLDLENMTGDQFLGAVAVGKFHDADPIPCYGGHASEDYTVVLPDDKKAGSLPKGVTIDTPNVHYLSRWTATDDGFTLHRELAVKFDTALCTGQTRTSLLDALQQMRNDVQSRVAVIDR